MKRLFMMFFLVVAAFVSNFGQVGQTQAMFIYNFSRLIKWPEQANNGNFIIGVVGSDEVYTSLVNYTAGKKVGAQPIIVRKFTDSEQVTACHIIFIGNSKISKLNEILSRLQGSNSLIITEKKGMVNSGSAIDLFILDDKLKFVINSSNAEKHDLIVSKALEDMSYKD